MILKISKFKIRINQKRTIYLAIVFIFALVSFYIFNLGFVVANASKMTKIEREIGLLSHKVGEMEAELMVHQNDINLDLAYSLGFKETNKIKFISKRSVATILGSNSIQ